MSSEWTLLVYMAADNNLASHAEQNLAEMKKASTAAGVTVLVQLDLPGSSTTRYRINSGSVDPLASFPNVNSGDPAVLTDFIDWGLGTYPARRSGLVVWDHGGGWEDPKVDWSAYRRPRPHFPPGVLDPERYRIGDDDTSRDYLTDQEFRQAIENTRLKRVDLLGCDACLMSMVEIAYEMRNVASFFVSSETNAPAAGWPYAGIINALAAQPTISPGDLAKSMVGRFKERCDESGTNGTLSALQLSWTDTVAAAIDQLAAVLSELLLDDRAAVEAARDQVIELENVHYVDLGSLLDALDPLNEPVHQAVVSTRNALKLMMGASATSGQQYEGLSGLSIFFPNGSDGGLSFLSSYPNLQFGRTNRWFGFLRGYLDFQSSLNRAKHRVAGSPQLWPWKRG